MEDEQIDRIVIAIHRNSTEQIRRTYSVTFEQLDEILRKNMSISTHQRHTILDSVIDLNERTRRENV